MTYRDPTVSHMVCQSPNGVPSSPKCVIINLTESHQHPVTLMDFLIFPGTQLGHTLYATASPSGPTESQM